MNNNKIKNGQTRSFYLADWFVEPASDCIRDSDQQRKLESKVMAVLTYLASRPGEVISREELEREVWGNTVVSYDALTASIAKLRKALNDNPRQPRFIDTVAKKGYRLIAAVKTTELQTKSVPAENEPPRRSGPVAAIKPELISDPRRSAGETHGCTSVVGDRSRERLAAINPDHKSDPRRSASVGAINFTKITTFSSLAIFGLLLSILIMAYAPVDDPLAQNTTIINNTPAIAILPFADFSQTEKTNELTIENSPSHLGDGITEDITSAMARLSGVTVIARSSAMSYKDQPTDIREVAKALGVRYLVEGSVRRSASQLRINAQLIDGETGHQLWSQHYDSNLDNLFAVQDAITRRIVDTLSIKLSQQETQRLSHRYTTSTEAYEQLLKGQSLFSHHSEQSNAQARALFQHAIELDPYFARAYGTLALTYIDDYRYQWTNTNSSANTNTNKNKRESLDTALDTAKRLANKALSIDAQLPQAHWVLANVYLFDKQLAEAIAAAKRAIALQPNYADAYATLAIANLYNGQPQTAVRLINKAMRLNPFSPARYRSALGQAYFFMGEYKDAEVVLNNAIERNAALTPARVFLIATLNKLGKKDEAAWEMEQLRLVEPGFGMEEVGEMFPVGGEGRELMFVVNEY